MAQPENVGKIFFDIFIEGHFLGKVMKFQVCASTCSKVINVFGLTGSVGPPPGLEGLMQLFLSKVKCEKFTHGDFRTYYVSPRARFL